MPKVVLTEEQRQKEKMLKRMDKFDSVVTEYLRATGFTTDQLSARIGVSKSTLWRYRTHAESFSKAPFSAITAILHLANCSNETIRYICGL